MFVYALARSVHNGYLPADYMRVAENGYRGIKKEFVKTDASGRLNLERTVSVGGLGGKPYRNGSYEYYLSEKVVTNDPKGIGALLLAATEMEIAVVGQYEGAPPWSAVPWHRFDQSADKSAHSKEASNSN
jgi:unsaturated rhamnogalacturonyl hydrolase